VREIKYRAYHEKSDTWLYSKDAFNNLWIEYITDEEGKYWETLNSLHDYEQSFVENLVFMQKIGLKDLYECDIISDNIGTGYIEYVPRKAAFRVKYGDGTGKWFVDYLDSELDSIEMIGNLYENPELLSA
jgi:NurA-like 5'-3' nuclease